MKNKIVILLLSFFLAMSSFGNIASLAVGTSEETVPVSNTEPVQTLSTSNQIPEEAASEVQDQEVYQPTTDTTEEVETQEVTEAEQVEKATEEPTTEPAEEKAMDSSFSATVNDRDNNLLSLRESTDEPVTVNWKTLSSNENAYEFVVQLTDYVGATGTSSRTVEIDIPYGVIVRKSRLNQIVAQNTYITKWEIKNQISKEVNQVNTNFQSSTLFNSGSGNDYTNNYVTGATISFDFNLQATTGGFSLNLFPDYVDNGTRTYWSGTQNSSLTRGLPLKVRVLEDGVTSQERILDNIFMTSAVEKSIVTNSDGGTSSRYPGIQTLDNEQTIYIQTRLRINEENSSWNAYYMSNPTWEVYAPYKKLASGKYLSAKIDETKMNSWIDSITSANGNEKLLQYKLTEKADGRVVVQYSFVNQGTPEEYLLQVSTLELYYTLFSTPESGTATDNNSFKDNDEILFTNDNIGWSFTNTEYDASGNASVKTNPVWELSDSTLGLKITDDNEKLVFDKDHAVTGNWQTYQTSEDQQNLLGFTLIKETTGASGLAKANYEFDINNTWKYGVTTVQFWTVASDFGGSLSASQDYVYTFDFVLQKKGTTGSSGQLKGTYQLIPSIAYKGKNITRDEGIEKPLLGYSNNNGSAVERYYYYVNRQMLFSAVDNADDYDLSDYYIKNLSYDFDVTPNSAAVGYTSGNATNLRNTGGNFFGTTFGTTTSSTAPKATLSVGAKDKDRGEVYSNTVTTTIQKDKTTNRAEVALGLRNMTVKNQAGDILSTTANYVNVGDKVTVAATAIAEFYPFADGQYSPNPVFIIRTPVDFDLDTESIKVSQKGSANLTYELSQAFLLGDDGINGKAYVVTLKNSSGLGYYNEERELIGNNIQISYDMEVNIAARGLPVSYKELLFIADKDKDSGYGGTNTAYYANDSWGIKEAVSGLASVYQRTNESPRLTNFGVNYQFNTVPGTVDFGLDTSWNDELIEGDETTVGVLDQSNQEIEATYSMDNTKQSGYVGSNGRYYFYIPIPKAGINQPEWYESGSEIDFSLNLTGEITFESSRDVVYKAYYSTDTNLLYHNGSDALTGSTGYANYVEYDQVKNNLSDVTMIKVVAQVNTETNVIIPYGEKMSATVPLEYSGDTDSFNEAVGDRITWTPYAVQRYTLGSATSDFYATAPSKQLRIRYRPEKVELDIWAFNETDYPSTDKLKQISYALPNFKNNFDLSIDKLTATSLDLVTSTNLETENSVLYGNRTYAIANDFNLSNQTELLSNTANAALGNTVSGGTNTLSYSLKNGDYINEVSTSRKVEITYKSSKSDDLLFKIVLNIRRLPSMIHAENTLLAGKHYRTINNDKGDGSTTTLQDGAFTAQFAFETKAYEQESEVQSIVSEDIYLDLQNASLPKGATIILKNQSIIDENDSTKLVAPEYYYYEQTSNQAVSKISLSEFKKMGTETPLTNQIIGSHIVDNDTVSYLCIIDYGNCETLPATGNGSIDLKFKDSPDESLDFTINQKREITSTTALDKSVYKQNESINLSGTVTTNGIGDAIDAFNFARTISLEAELLDANDAFVAWPQGTYATDSEGTRFETKLVDGKLIIVYPTYQIDNKEQSLNYQLTIHMLTEALSVNDYKVQVNLYTDFEGEYPFLNNAVSSSPKLAFSIEKDNSGLRIVSELEERLIYHGIAQQQVTLNYSQTEISKVAAGLQVLDGQEYVDASSEVTDKIFTDLASEIDNTTLSATGSWTVTFNEQLEASLDGEYRLVIKAYDDQGQLLQEVPWTFVIWKP